MLGVLTPFVEASLVRVHLVPPLPASEVRTVRADLSMLLPPRVVGIDFLAFPPRFLIVLAPSRFHHATSWPYSCSQPSDPQPSVEGPPLSQQRRGGSRYRSASCHASCHASSDGPS